MTWWLRSADMVLVIGAASAFFAGLCYQMRHSRCENISLCWGCWKCNRKLQSDEEAAADDIRNKTRVPSGASEPDAPDGAEI